MARRKVGHHTGNVRRRKRNAANVRSGGPVMRFAGLVACRVHEWIPRGVDGRQKALRFGVQMVGPCGDRAGGDPPSGGQTIAVCLSILGNVNSHGSAVEWKISDE